MIERLVLLAQDVVRYNRGLNTFKIGLSMVGVAIILVAVGVLIAKPNHREKALPKKLQWSVAGIITALGLGLIAYAWLAF